MNKPFKLKKSVVAVALTIGGLVAPLAGQAPATGPVFTAQQGLTLVIGRIHRSEVEAAGNLRDFAAQKGLSADKGEDRLSQCLSSPGREVFLSDGAAAVLPDGQRCHWLYRLDT